MLEVTMVLANRVQSVALCHFWLWAYVVHLRLAVSAAASSSSVLITRGASSGPKEEGSQDGGCEFVGEIVVSHPMSINKDDRYYVTGSLSWEAVNLVLDQVNSPQRCGVSLSTGNYSLQLNTYGDSSSKEQVASIAEFIAQDNKTQFFLGPYASSLTAPLAIVAQQNEKILIAGGAAQTHVFENKDHVFGLLPPSLSYLENSMHLIHQKGAKTVATLREEGTSACQVVPMMAELLGFEWVGHAELARGPNPEDFLPVAQDMAGHNPDVMVSCVYDVGCAKWIDAMRSVGWSPKMQIFTHCIGTSELLDTAGAANLAYMMGATSWVKDLPPIADGAVGWAPEQFSQNFEAFAFRNVTYQYAAAASSLSVLVQAIEIADSLETSAVRDVIATTTFSTIYGKTSFDENGQNQVPSLVLQYNTEGNLDVVFPLESVTKDLEAIYPMPGWDERDCLLLSTCAETGGSCQEDGKCSCPQDGLTSIGLGTNATCKTIVPENMSKISEGLIYLGLSLFILQFCLSAIFVGWTYRYRNHPIVRAAQPFFLVLMALSAVIITSSIVPLSLQNGEYRYELDPETGLPTDQPAEDVDRLDKACMGFVWLAGLGFALLISALLAKLQRIRQLMAKAIHFRREQVMIQDVAYIIVVFVTLQCIPLLVWQLVDPLRWERTVTVEDPDGFPLESVGKCASDSSLAFTLPIFFFDMGALFYCVWLCYKTRTLPDEFAESKWVTVSIGGILQIMLLTVPIVVIASEERSADYFVRAGVVFGVGATVTILIFVPKMVRIWFWTNDDHVAKISTPRHSFAAVHRSGYLQSSASDQLHRSGHLRSSATSDQVVRGLDPGSHFSQDESGHLRKKEQKATNDDAAKEGKANNLSPPNNKEEKTGNEGDEAKANNLSPPNNKEEKTGNEGDDGSKDPEQSPVSLDKCEELDV